MEIVREIRKVKPFTVSISSAPGIIAFVVDSKGKFVAMNNDAEKAIGYKEKDVVGTAFSKIIQKGEIGNFRDNFRSIIKGHRFPSFRTKFQTKKGKQMHVEINCNPFHSDGALLGVEIVARDITQRMEARNKLKLAPKRKAAPRKKTAKKKAKPKKTVRKRKK